MFAHGVDWNIRAFFGLSSLRHKLHILVVEC